MPKAKVIKGSDGEHYSIDAPNGTSGDLFEYGTIAVCEEDGNIYLCAMDGPDEEPVVTRVTSTVQIPCDVEEVDIEIGDEDDDDEETEEDAAAAEAIPQD